MEKKQFWIVGVVAVVVMVALAVISYRMFSTSTQPMGSEKDTREQTTEEAQATPNAESLDSGTLSLVPNSTVSVDGVAIGIASDLDTETGVLGTQATDTASILQHQGDVITDLDNAYEQDAF